LQILAAVKLGISRCLGTDVRRPLAEFFPNRMLGTLAHQLTAMTAQMP
jgi:hypothetical protein